MTNPTRQNKLTPEAKSHLASTIRGLRERLLRDLRDTAEQDYRLSVRAQDAGLTEAARTRRRRLEDWLDEQVRTATASATAKGTKSKSQPETTVRERFLSQAVKLTAATLLNRIVLIRHMEALELIKPAVITGGWNSRGYREFRDFAPALAADDTEGYAHLLALLFDELALDLPGLFGDVGLSRLLRVPASTLREIVEQLDDPTLDSAWTDDTTLGWVYQYWNDPEREALDAKLNSGGKVEPHEIASKTQMFTERYMVEWLLHNSLGLTWLAMCKKHGWPPDADLVLDDLDSRRADWRERREKGDVALDALMPIAEGIEDRWKYYVPQPIPDDAVTSAPDSIRDLKLLDPACGSGHFLIIAFDLLAELYREESRHRAETWTDQYIAESILANNLHGVDIDHRAIQIAAAGVYLKARLLSPVARIRQLNLVAPCLSLATLPSDDPALVRLVRDVREETGIPEELTRKLVSSLAGVDSLGTLLKVDSALAEAVVGFESSRADKGQVGFADPSRSRTIYASNDSEAKTALLANLERFLSSHGSAEDLGLRLDGEQLASGVRFIRIVRESTYELVVGNPPYQGTSKMADAKYVAKHYPRGKADLYAAFLERGLELACPGGMSSLLTMRGWMFINQFRAIREWLLSDFDLRSIGDLAIGAFDEVPNDVLSVAITTFRKSPPTGVASVATQPSPPDDKSYDRQRTNRKRAAVLAQVGRHEFDPRGFKVIDGEPLVYWWDDAQLKIYRETPKLEDVCTVREGLGTRDDVRYLRRWWEPYRTSICALRHPSTLHRDLVESKWLPFIKGAAGKVWIEPLDFVVRWFCNGIEIGTYKMSRYGRGATAYFQPGIAISTVGSLFSGRLHRYLSIFGDAGVSAFPVKRENVLCVMNSVWGRRVLESLNPTISFKVNDLNRLPVWNIDGAESIVGTLDIAFTEHESAQEISVEFSRPGPSPWRYTQDWAQRAVDRRADEPLPNYEPEFEPPSQEQLVSFGVGVALGRFGADGEGILDESKQDHRALVERALPAGILFLSDVTERDSLELPACDLLEAMWEEHGTAVSPKEDLRTYLRQSYFDYHRKLYESRPIYFPLSSSKRTFVAYVAIHRWRSDTLQTLLADHLMPERQRLDGELEDLRKARAARSTTAKTEKRFSMVKKAVEELECFIASVTEIAEGGAPPTDSKCPPRKVDARFEMDLDDGVMVNSAALWPLLDPQWKTGSCPKKWWKELCTAKGKKDYDWAHLAERYFPTRVDEKCQEDPSLGVAHGCFWKYHPAKAYQWELRLQDEIRPDVTIDEEGSDQYRARFLEEHAAEAEEIRAKEQKRRDRKERKGGKGRKVKGGAKAGGGDGPLFDRVDDDAVDGGEVDENGDDDEEERDG